MRCQRHLFTQHPAATKVGSNHKSVQIAHVKISQRKNILWRWRLSALQSPETSAILHTVKCQVMAWMAEYHEMLRELGIEEDDLQFAGSHDHGTFQLTEKYISRVEATLIAWFTNILEVLHNFRRLDRESLLHRSFSLTDIAEQRLVHEIFHKKYLSWWVQSLEPPL